MAKPMTYQQTLSQMALWGLKVIEYPGWRTRGRDPEHGPFSNVRGIVIHHTGSDAGQSDDYLHFLAIDGRPGLPGPLCNVSTDMDGDLHLIAQGRANHAGEGSSQTGAHVLNEDYAGYSIELHPGPDDNFDGNAVYYGNEVRYDGGQPMTPRQYASAVRWAAAVCHFHGWSALSIVGHREHTRRKDDPGHCAMNKFRSDVAALLKAGPPTKDTGTGNTPTPPKEVDDVALTTAQQLAIAKAGWLADQFAQGAQFETDLDTAIANGETSKTMLGQVALKGQVDELKGQLAEVKALLGQVLAKLPTPPAT